jgi:RNA polymerase sigma factor (sigma-70 family)
MADFPPTRASLLLRLRDPRDGDAWRQFVDLYAPVVYRYARKQGLQDADGADLSQEVLRAVAGAVGRLEYDPRRGAFRNWLFTIVRRKLSNWRVAQQVRTRGSGDSATLQLLEQYPAPDEGMTEWNTEWERQLVAWACAQIRQEVAPSSWQAFWKTAVEGLPGKQVAKELGLTVAAVYHARSRILGRIKQLVRSAEDIP